MFWTQPGEQAVRAPSTLVQYAGAEKVAAARAVVDAEVAKRLKNSRQLVDLAADGHINKMKEELREFADPGSVSESGKPALVAAAESGEVKAVELLLDFKAPLDAV